jgi:uncharacterized repeat protein (TIGR03803 family)
MAPSSPLRTTSRLLGSAVALPVVLLLAVLAPAQTFTTLYNFAGEGDGGWPWAAVIQDKLGNLYGTALVGGNLGCGGGGCGVVFEVSSAGTESVLHIFTRGTDGFYSYTPLIRDNKGNLYGVTSYGGVNRCTEGCGVVFKLNTTGKETLLHSFAGDTSDGCGPFQGLVMDNAGNLYGTTFYCGSSNGGTIFKIDTAGKETILHSFAGGASDGRWPGYGHLVIDEKGNLYGLTQDGGSTGCSGNGCGVLYKLTPKGEYIVLHIFAGGSSDGCNPAGSVAMDKVGNLYGTTQSCGSSNYGTVWKVSKKGRETILHHFAGYPSDGCYPVAGVSRDSKGNLYGVTVNCGSHLGGAVYELRASGRLTLLHSFDYSDGAVPDGEVLLTDQGMLYGTSNQRGVYGFGTVWKYVP